MMFTKTAKQAVQFRPDNKAVYSPVLNDLPGIQHASTTREFSAGLAKGTGRLDEMLLTCSLIEMPNACLALGEQKHTANIAIVDKATFHGRRHYTFPETDALVTDLPGAVLAIQTADCTPVFLVDPNARVIGLIHAGWRGTHSRITEKTVAKMKSLGANPDDITAWIGPLASVCCYEVSTELIESFLREFPTLSEELLRDERKLNLSNINIAQLERAGLNADNIFDSGICTIHQSDQFFSYRADNGTTGRIISALGMLEK